jgi:hypothetical protein
LKLIQKPLKPETLIHINTGINVIQFRFQNVQSTFHFGEYKFSLFLKYFRTFLKVSGLMPRNASPILCFIFSLVVAAVRYTILFRGISLETLKNVRNYFREREWELVFAKMEDTLKSELYYINSCISVYLVQALCTGCPKFNAQHGDFGYRWR